MQTSCRQKTIIGNWKMHKTRETAIADFRQFASAMENHGLHLGVAAPSVFLSDLSRIQQGFVGLYAQNVHWAAEGALTGEISVPMLQSVGVTGSLVAHSERRSLFGETHQTAGLRIKSLLQANLSAVFCVGETLAEREAGQLRHVLTEQLTQAFAAAEIAHGAKLKNQRGDALLLLVAYEPVWAIGTGRSATAAEAQDAHRFIRAEIGRLFDHETAEQLKILYGGSVKASNIREFLSCPDIDGALVGGASLLPQEFSALCAEAR